MRDLGWRIVMPPLEDQSRARAIAELRRARILPVDRRRFDRVDYVRTLIVNLTSGALRAMPA
ncbi:hypothetical protein [Hansschlegelia plantiphila]|uniref:Uncharacterized protein n=1 Tax=Hansschlegelia plantiphila TaxID=374655 RepID=A0A9W6MVL8_9HYPH|nr:hypothetical protein [Hansschlegelia plantiphila]GLK67870.1 hypothetical protein GCM10008179_15080 [Hansschlegelia plantiphila]